MVAPYRTDLMRHAGQEMIYPAGQEAELFKSVESGKATDGLDAYKLKALKEALGEAKNPVIILGAFVLSSVAATKAAEALAEAVGAKVMKLGQMANSYGLEAAQITSEKGYADLIANSNALILSNLDPAQNAEIGERLKNLELLVVHDAFETETTKLAHVVLPAKTGYEKEGTVVNLEGRFLNVSPAPVDSGTSEDFTGVVRALGEAMGTRLEGRSIRSARRALQKTFELDFAALPEEGQLAPVKADDAKDTATEAVKGNLLLTPSFLKLERLERNPKLYAAYGDAALRVNPADAKEQGLEAGTEVVLTAGKVKRKARVVITENAPEGLMLFPATFNQPVGLATAEVTPTPELVA